MSGRKGMHRVQRGAPLAERLAAFTTVAPSGCWVWMGADNTRGYGVIRVDGKGRYAHRLSYELHVGPIPAGHQIDHLCRYPRCINPRHLQAVTPTINVRRGTSPGARAIRGGACHRGHSRAEHGYQSGPRTYCRACQSAYHATYQKTYVQGSPNPAIARELRDGRLRLGYSQREVAALLGVTDVRVSSIERCKCEPTADLLARMRELYAPPLAGAA